MVSDYPITTAREFAAALGVPVLTTDVPAFVSAIHRHYALGMRDAMPRAQEVVALAEREACAQVCADLSAKLLKRSLRRQHHHGAGLGASMCEDAIRARGKA